MPDKLTCLSKFRMSHEPNDADPLPGRDGIPIKPTRASSTHKKHLLIVPQLCPAPIADQ